METHTILGKIAKKRQTGCRPLFPMVRCCEVEELESRAEFAIEGGAPTFFSVTWKFASRLRHVTNPTVWHILQHQNPTALPPRYAFDTAMTGFQIGFE
jgi:hypothetical protein